MSNERVAEWDLFISHASEDKDDFVRPLATSLTEAGVSVWFDETAIRLGDSLSRAIDSGLARSSFGLVVISPAFLRKDWPEHELSGLAARGVGKNSIILPIWHGVSVEDVRKYSPTLAGLKAVRSDDLELDEIVITLVDRVRPDLSDGVQRRRAYERFRRTLESAKLELVPTSELAKAAENSPIRHAELPRSVQNRIRIVQLVFEDVLPLSFEETLMNFQRDSHPVDEVEVWERMAAIYLLVGGARWEPEHRSRLMSALLAATSGAVEDAAEVLASLPESHAQSVVDAYIATNSGGDSPGRGVVLGRNA